MSQTATSAETNPPIPAATVVLLRDGAHGLETLMLRRNAAVTFGGMWVFPGGRLDAADGEGDDGARRAAAREAMEEAGLVVDPDALVPISHWVPPPEAPKRFATWFFVAPAPAGSVVVDMGEIHDHVWTRPRDVLDRHAAGELELAPPTWITLQRLGTWRTVADALAGAAAGAIDHYATRIGSDDGELIALWDGDAGYADADASRPGPRHRLVMARAGWRYEKT